MRELSVEGYLESLASRNSTPGGGAVAAITGAQLAALITMVARFTAINTDNKETLESIIDRAEKARIEFLNLGEQDVTAFNAVMTAYRMPKGSESKEEALQDALKAAATAPLLTLELSQSLASDIEILARIGNKNLTTDIGMAALLVPATIESAQMNVMINLKGIKEKKFIKNTLQKIELAKECKKRMEQIKSDILQSL
ncbi:MAG: formiminotetrahydrofolate cyclodeaminase [Candidatus Azotimanducaceae bacterium]|jgi:formiminotetrahydrofolate cyclodeaminase